MINLSGDWNSYYRYPSPGRGDDFWGQHLLHATQTGNKLVLETAADSASHVVITLELDADGKTATGTWAEDTDPQGYYKGRRYEGTIDLKVADTTERMNGIWQGAGRDGTMHSDIWELARVKKQGAKGNLPKRWKLTHWYPSVNDETEEFAEHDMKAYWSDDTMVLESLPREDKSYILVRLLIQDGVAAGSWYESSLITGESQGAQYSGAGQLIVDAKTYHMEGLWAGAGYDHKLNKMRIYTGKWEITPLTD